MTRTPAKSVGSSRAEGGPPSSQKPIKAEKNDDDKKADKAKVKDEGGDCDGEGDTGRGRGAPQKDPVRLARSYWAKFNTADEDSNFFGETSLVLRRLLTRHANSISSMAISATGAKKEALDEAKKQLQVMEHCIVMFGDWKKRKDNSSGIAKFKQQWDLLLVLSKAEPEILLQCNHIWGVYLEVTTMRSLENNVSLWTHMQMPAFMGKLTGVSEDGCFNLQMKYSIEWIAYCLCEAVSLEASFEGIIRLCGEALRLETGVMPAILSQSEAYMLVSKPFVPRFAADMDLDKIQRVEREVKENFSGTLYNPLHSFPARGVGILKKFSDLLNLSQGSMEWLEKVKKSIPILEGINPKNVAQLFDSLKTLNEYYASMDAEHVVAYRSALEEDRPDVAVALGDGEVIALQRTSVVVRAVWSQSMAFAVRGEENKGQLAECFAMFKDWVSICGRTTRPKALEEEGHLSILVAEWSEMASLGTLVFAQGRLHEKAETSTIDKAIKLCQNTLGHVDEFFRLQTR
jgi:hypothetical protein